MLIGLCGGICAGKSSVASYLIDKHQFKRIHLIRTSSTPPVETSASNARVPPIESAPLEKDHVFPTVDALLDFVTLRWRERWVTTDIWDDRVVDALIRRPFFLMVSIDAPVSIRWQRFKDRCAANKLTPPTLEEFVLRNDNHQYAPGTGLCSMFQRAQIKLLNSTTSISSLHKALKTLELPNEARLRPSWDQYFMQLADLAAHRSNCMKRRVGCVVVREKRVISTGYNGTPRGMTNCNEGGCPRCNGASRAGADLSTCLCLHAEENALLEAGRDRIRENSILYCNTCPCLTCSVKITQVGISEVVYNQGYLVDSQTAAIFAESGVRLRQFVPPSQGLIDLSVGEMEDGGEKEEEGVADIRETLNDDDFVRPIPDITPSWMRQLAGGKSPRSEDAKKSTPQEGPVDNTPSWMKNLAGPKPTPDQAKTHEEVADARETLNDPSFIRPVDTTPAWMKQLTADKPPKSSQSTNTPPPWAKKQENEGESAPMTEEERNLATLDSYLDSYLNFQGKR